MTEKPLAFIEILKQHGYSKTKPRRAVFNVLQHTHDAISMNDLIKQLAPIDRASVYRCIELFEQLGIVQRIQIGWKYKLELSDMFRDHHHHALCTSCSSILPIEENSKLEQLINNLGAAYDFQVTNHSLEIHGLCNTCRKSVSTKRSRP